jgi:hypothetical protein
MRTSVILLSYDLRRSSMFVLFGMHPGEPHRLERSLSIATPEILSYSTEIVTTHLHPRWYCHVWIDPSHKQLARVPANRRLACFQVGVLKRDDFTLKRFKMKAFRGGMKHQHWGGAIRTIASCLTQGVASFHGGIVLDAPRIRPSMSRWTNKYFG